MSDSSGKAAPDYNRKDIVYKAAVRLLKRFYKNIFKNKNLEIVKRRYVNCTSEQIFARMKETLEQFLPEEEITPDLVQFTMGITCVVKPKKLT